MTRSSLVGHLPPSHARVLPSLTERMSRKWTSCVYAFFEATPTIEYVDGRKCHSFKCLAKGCRQKIRRYLGGNDAQSTGNMRRHAKSCWGEDTIRIADGARNVSEARTKIVRGILHNGSITAAFERKDKGKVSYSHRQHTKTETRYVARTIYLFNIDRHYIWKSGNRSMGFGKLATLPDCQRPRFPVSDENRSTWILLTITFNCFARCESCICKSTQPHCKVTARSYTLLIPYPVIVK